MAPSRMRQRLPVLLPDHEQVYPAPCRVCLALAMTRMHSSKSLARLGAQAIQDEIRRVQSELDAIDAELLSSDLS